MKGGGEAAIGPDRVNELITARSAADEAGGEEAVEAGPGPDRHSGERAQVAVLVDELALTGEFRGRRWRRVEIRLLSRNRSICASPSSGSSEQVL